MFVWALEADACLVAESNGDLVLDLFLEGSRTVVLLEERVTHTGAALVAGLTHNITCLSVKSHIFLLVEATALTFEVP